MKHGGYETQEELLFSTLYGGSVYRPVGTVVKDPLSTEPDAQSPLYEHVRTGEVVFLRRFHLDPGLWERYAGRVLSPPDRNAVFWPVDVVELSAEQAEGCTAFVDRQYTDRPIPAEQRSGKLGAVFPYSGLHRMVSAEEKLPALVHEGWKNGELRQMAVQVAGTIDALNREGFLYNDFHLSRFFFRENGALYLDHSHLAVRGAERESGWLRNGTNYPIEFADPAVVRGIVPAADFRAQNYSLCALLFYLLFGQYAYDGKLTAGYADDSRETHYFKFRDYHKMPVFIFDPEDHSNEIGLFGDEAKTVALWNEAPGALKALFVSALREGSALRNTLEEPPTAAQWLACFDELGWRDGMERKDT